MNVYKAFMWHTLRRMNVQRKFQFRMCDHWVGNLTIRSHQSLVVIFNRATKSKFFFMLLCNAIRGVASIPADI